ncbi:hypothetical protein L207DRAFT_376382, partial [Hyaloscypha variabilis F]
SPVTLLVYHQRRLDEYEKVGRKSVFKTHYCRNQSLPCQQSPDRTLATESGPAPILNLISAVRSSPAVGIMRELKCRLRRETTVVATQSTMGTIEDIYHRVFPDPQSRPTFLIGTMSHNVWEVLADTSNYQLNKDDLQHVLTHGRVKQANYTVVTSGYFIDKLIECKDLNARRVDQSISLRFRLKTAVRAAVFGPMTALQGCNIGAIFDDEQWKVIGMALINEAWLIIRHDLPGAISREVVTKWVTGEIREKSGCAHSMLTDMMEGHNTDAEAVNGWFVKSGK